MEITLKAFWGSASYKGNPNHVWIAWHQWNWQLLLNSLKQSVSYHALVRHLDPHTAIPLSSCNKHQWGLTLKLLLYVWVTPTQAGLHCKMFICICMYLCLFACTCTWPYWLPHYLFLSTYHNMCLKVHFLTTHCFFCLEVNNFSLRVEVSNGELQLVTPVSNRVGSWKFSTLSETLVSWANCYLLQCLK